MATLVALAACASTCALGTSWACCLRAAACAALLAFFLRAWRVCLAAARGRVQVEVPAAGGRASVTSSSFAALTRASGAGIETCWWLPCCSTTTWQAGFLRTGDRGEPPPQSRETEAEWPVPAVSLLRAGLGGAICGSGGAAALASVSTGWRSSLLLEDAVLVRLVVLPLSFLSWRRT